jgi:branched-chain amino acid transport system ATP-binding protein
MTSAVHVTGLVARFGGLAALGGVDVTLRRGEVLGVIGANGAGKTTLMNCICGLHRAAAGEIAVEGKPIAGLLPHEIARLGVGRTFQTPRVFRRMSLADNLLVPVLSRTQDDAVLLAQARAMLERMQLAALEHNHAHELSGGQQKLLEMARLLMRDPAVVLLDEPFAGVHPTLCRFMIGQIRHMAEEGKAVLLVSHDITSIYELSTRVAAMHQGRIIAEGSMDEVRANAAVIESYLGA